MKWMLGVVFGLASCGPVLACPPYPKLAGDWTCTVCEHPGSTENIEQTGLQVNFTNDTNDAARGTFNSNCKRIVTTWGNGGGNLKKHKGYGWEIDWDDRNIWVQNTEE